MKIKNRFFTFISFKRTEPSKFGGWIIDFDTWWISYDWDLTDKYGFEWSFDISSLKDITYLYIGDTDKSFIPKINLKTKFKEVSWLGINLGWLWFW